MPITTFSNRRLATVMLLTLLPWPAVWVGMYKLSNIVATFFLYHGVCLLLPVIGYRRFWQGSLKLPTWRQTLLVIVAAVVVSAAMIWLYSVSGSSIVDKKLLLQTLAEHGLEPSALIPAGLYFVVVNATLEELFWRGVVLNELEDVLPAQKHFGMLWTACTFAAWHYLVLRLLLQPGYAELTVVALVIFGACMSWLYRKCGSIVLPILWHAVVFDLALIVLLGFIAR